MTTEQMPAPLVTPAATDKAPEPAVGPGRWGGGRGGRARRDKFAISTALGALGIVFVLPIIWLVDAASNPNATQALGAPALSVANFRAAITAGAGGAIRNSLYLAVISTIVATSVSTLAAYALFAAGSRSRGPSFSWSCSSRASR